MQENNFEKQVRQKLDDLQLRPSEEVWQKLSVAIAKRKSYRKIGAIVFMLFLFISSAIIYLWNQRLDVKMNKTVSINNNSTQKNNSLQPKEDSNSLQIMDVVTRQQTGKKYSVSNNLKQVDDKPVIKKNIPLPAEIPVKTITTASVKQPGKNPRDVNAGLRHDKAGFNHTTGPKVTVLTSKVDPVNLADENAGTYDTSKTITAEPDLLANDLAIKVPVMDSVERENIDVIIQEKDTPTVIQNNGHNKVASVKTGIKLKQKSKWKIGLNFSAGVAATKNGYLGIISQVNRDATYLYSSPAQSNGGTVNPGTFVPAASNTVAGAGFVFGFFLQKNISPKTNFLGGLNYKIYTSAITIGNRVDSSNNFSRNNFFYRSGNTKKYRNHFHFIELPVALRVKLGKQNKLPVYLNSGISIAQLLGSNALQFDTSSGAYYKDNTLFHKTQVSVSAGLLFSLSGNAKNPLLIGPDINFGLTKMAGSGLYKDRHYSYLGILLQKTIGKK